MASGVHTVGVVRICLYLNEVAGEGNSEREITRLIEHAGHTVARVVTRLDELRAARPETFDCVAVAGGDGTVAAVGRLLAFGRVPLAILSLGTANNIATSLGVAEDPQRAVDAWNLQKIVRVDVGVVRDANGECLFLEGVGVGLVPAGIEAGNAHIPKGEGDRSASLDAGRELFLKTLSTLRPRQYGLTIEGTSLDEASLLVEVLNTPWVGPRVRFSEEANAADGMLSVVVAGEDDRESIADHLRGPWDDERHHAQLKTWRASHVEVRGWHDYHVDDEVRVANGETVSIHVEPGALPVLA
jgi:diacylglycerol kinase (ATP)